ncbi:MAG: pentapeptide repeat-containing protein [Geminicoccaceae bacterium]
MTRALASYLVALAVLAPEAYAACTDTPAPSVQWRRCLLDGIDLGDDDLSGGDLRDASFKRADLTGANLTNIQGRRAKFVSATMGGADLTGADLVQADFTNADLSGANLKSANLRGARLFQANLRGVDLTDAVLDGADLLHVDFSGARWTDGRTICAEGSTGSCRPGGGAGTKVQG